MMKKIFLLFFLIFLFLLLTPLLAWTGGTNCPEEGLVPCGTEGCPCEFCDFFVMIERWIKGLLVPTPGNPIPIVLIIATLMIAIGGFMYVIAFIGMGEGGPEMISRAKRLFGAVAIGLLIVYGAWLIINFFLQIIGVTIWEGGGNWWTIPCS